MRQCGNNSRSTETSHLSVTQRPFHASTTMICTGMPIQGAKPSTSTRNSSRTGTACASQLQNAMFLSVRIPCLSGMVMHRYQVPPTCESLAAGEGIVCWRATHMLEMASCHWRYSIRAMQHRSRPYVVRGSRITTPPSHPLASHMHM